MIKKSNATPIERQAQQILDHVVHPATRHGKRVTFEQLIAADNKIPTRHKALEGLFDEDLLTRGFPLVGALQKIAHEVELEIADHEALKNALRVLGEYKEEYKKGGENRIRVAFPSKNEAIRYNKEHCVPAIKNLEKIEGLVKELAVSLDMELTPAPTDRKSRTR